VERLERLERLVVAVTGVFVATGRGEDVDVLRERAIGGTAMNSVEDLDVFKLAHQLALKTYSATKTFPKEETYSLGDQTRRATAISVSF
jgi:hypothetical protein